MTTLAPVLDLVGDVGSFSLFLYGGARWVAQIRHTGALELHRSGDGQTVFLDIDVPYPKKQVAVEVFGDYLLIFWTKSTTNELYLSKYHLGLRRYTMQPTLLWAGASPAAAKFKTTKLVLSYVDENDQHVYRVSLDEGVTWSAAEIVDTNTVTEVGIDVFPSTDHRVRWVETAA